LSSGLARASYVRGPARQSKRRKGSDNTSVLSTKVFSGDPVNVAEYYDAKGANYFRLAMRSKSVVEFRKRINQAKNSYLKAGISYREAKDNGSSARCNAWDYYLRFYLAKNASVKSHLLDQSWRLAKQALSSFRKTRDHLGFANTYDQLSTALALGFDYHWNSIVRDSKLREAVEYGREAIRLLSPRDDKKLLSKVCARTALFIDIQGDEHSEYDKQEEMDREGLEYWRRAEQLDGDTALLQVAYPPEGFFGIFDEEEGGRILERSLKLAKRIGDNFAIGWQLDNAASRRFFMAMTVNDWNDTLRISKESLKLAEEAASRYALLDFVTPKDGVLWSGAPYAEHFLQLSWYQTDPAKRRLLIEKGLHETRDLLRLAKKSGYPRLIAYSHHVTSKLTAELAETEADRKRKMKLLRKALLHRLENGRITLRIQPHAIHFVATYLRYLADIRALLADLEDDRRKKLALYVLAVKDKEKGLELNARFAENVSKGQPHVLKRIVGKNHLEYGDLLVRYYRVGGDEETLGKAARAYMNAAGFLKETTSYRYLGEAYWKAGEACDKRDENLMAAENFGLASKAYLTLSEKYPQLGTLFQEYSRYLEAWNNIEHARAAHKRLAYDEAEQYYRKASDLHSQAGRWTFLAPYYTGLAKLEAAEDLSRMGQVSRSVSEFKDAAQLFREATVSLQKHGTSIEQPEEKLMVEKMVAAPKEQYCLGRAIIEEARVAEDQGDYGTSADKFLQASKVLELAAGKTASHGERNDLLYISSLAMAWHHMARTNIAEPDRMFRKAGRQFIKSLEYRIDENSRAISLGHKYFCSALAASGRFSLTLDPEDYESGTRYLTIASSHFAKAGFNLQSTHVLACKLLLDAHMRIAESARQSDGSARARGFEEARTLLRGAADGFGRAFQTAKQQQVLRLIDSIDEQYGLFNRLAEISKTAATVSPTIAFPALAKGEELPVGHSRFSGADIEASYGPPTEITSRSDHEVTVEIRIGNTGNQSIRIERIDDLIPSGGRIVSIPPGSRVDGRSLLLDQKRTEPMGLETVRVTLQSRKGVLIVEPRIYALDDSGHEHERKLPGRMLTRSPILELLAKEFREDYKMKRLGLDHCGWRTLMDIVNVLKIPRSHLYGEPRYGRQHGRQLQMLIQSGLVESRIFPGERGRGGDIVKVRVAYDNPISKQLVEAMA